MHLYVHTHEGLSKYAYTYQLTYIHAYVEIFAWFFTIVCEVCECLWVCIKGRADTRVCALLDSMRGIVQASWNVFRWHTQTTHTQHTLSLTHTTQCTYILSDLAGSFRTTFRPFWKAPFSFPLPFPNHRTPTVTLGLRSSATSVRADTSLDCINIHVNTHLLLHVLSHEARTTHK